VNMATQLDYSQFLDSNSYELINYMYIAYFIVAYYYHKISNLHIHAAVILAKETYDCKCKWLITALKPGHDC